MLNILIVEDDVTIRELLSYNLKNNFKILEANSAEEAMDCLLYTSDSADEEERVEIGGRRIIKKK